MGRTASNTNLILGTPDQLITIKGRTSSHAAHPLRQRLRPTCSHISPRHQNSPFTQSPGPNRHGLKPSLSQSHSLSCPFTFSSRYPFLSFRSTCIASLSLFPSPKSIPFFLLPNATSRFFHITLLCSKRRSDEGNVGMGMPVRTHQAGSG